MPLAKWSIKLCSKSTDPQCVATGTWLFVLNKIGYVNLQVQTLWMFFLSGANLYPRLPGCHTPDCFVSHILERNICSECPKATSRNKLELYTQNCRLNSLDLPYLPPVSWATAWTLTRALTSVLPDLISLSLSLYVLLQFQEFRRLVFPPHWF